MWLKRDMMSSTLQCQKQTVYILTHSAVAKLVDHLFIYLFAFCSAFSGLVLLVGQQEGHTEWWSAGVVICLG